MRKILIAVAAFSLLTASISASARAPSSVVKAKALISKFKERKLPRKKKPLHAFDTPLLSFLPAPSTPTQGQNLTVIMESINNFTGRILSLDYSVNGGAVSSAPLVANVAFFSASLGNQTVVGPRYLDATLYSENAADHADVRNAIKALDTTINHLTTQINAERDPVQRAQLQEQRMEQLALKGELVYQLRKFRVVIGTQRFNYNVVANPSSPTNPRITSISPLSGSTNGGTSVTITGANFSANPSVSFGGVPAQGITYVNSSTIQAVTPSFFGAIGPVDVELRFNSNGQTYNVVSPGGFYVANTAVSPTERPVAVAAGSQKIALGSSAQFDGSLSYDNSVAMGQLSYSWTFVSVPSGSNYSVGQSLDSVVTPSFTPSVLGTYVVQLVVTQQATTDHLSSEPSLAVVQVGGSPTPVANPIVTRTGIVGTSQIFANDPSGGSSFVYEVTQAPIHGAVTISNSGLVSYTSTNGYVGTDSLEVKVTDQSGAFGSVAIPVSITQSNFAPAPSIPTITTHTEGGHALVAPNDPDLGQSFTYEVSLPASHGTVSVDGNGNVTYASQSGFTGSDHYVIRVYDNGSPQLTGEAVGNVTVLSNSTPQVSASDSYVAQGGITTVQASVSDDNGQSGTFSVSTPAHGSASISGSGLVTYQSNSIYGGDDSIVVSYTDNGSPNLTGTASIAIHVNGAPVVTFPLFNVPSGVSGTSQASATDPNGDSLTYLITTPPLHGTASISNSGLVTYTSQAGFTGGDSLIVKTTDNGTPSLSVFTALPIGVTANTNHAPTGTAPNIGVFAGATGTSQVSATDQDPGQTLSYSILVQPTQGTTSISSSGLVTYVANANATGSDSLTIRVSDNGSPVKFLDIPIAVSILTSGNQPPVIANALFFRIQASGVPYQCLLSMSSAGGVTFSDPDGTIARVDWDFGDGTHERTLDLLNGVVLHNYVATGTYTATLKVTDNLGAFTTKSFSVNVVNTDVPTAKFRASPTTGGGTVPVTVSFDASESASADGIVHYRWQWGSGAEEITTNPVISHTFNTAGNYNIRLTTRNTLGGEGFSTVVLTIGSAVAGSRSIAQFTVGPPREVLVNTPHTFNGSRSFNPNVGTTIAAYNWTFNGFNCGVVGDCTATGINASHTYTTPGNSFPSLVATTGAGSTTLPATMEVFSVNQGHAPHAVMRPSATRGVAPFTVNLSSLESYDYDGNIDHVLWFFGDGSNVGTDAAVDHTFTNTGAFPVTLQVYDNDNNPHSVTQTITVTATKDEIPRKLFDQPYDPEREYQRQVVAGACNAGNAESCSQLADMYAEDGDSFTSSELKARACSMGYQPACER